MKRKLAITMLTLAMALAPAALSADGIGKAA
jgi:hypothetical protein